MAGDADLLVDQASRPLPARSKRSGHGCSGRAARGWPWSGRTRGTPCWCGCRWTRRRAGSSTRAGSCCGAFASSTGKWGACRRCSATTWCWRARTAGSWRWTPLRECWGTRRRGAPSCGSCGRPYVVEVHGASRRRSSSRWRSSRDFGRGPGRGRRRADRGRLAGARRGAPLPRRASPAAAPARRTSCGRGSTCAPRRPRRGAGGGLPRGADAVRGVAGARVPRDREAPRARASRRAGGVGRARRRVRRVFRDDAAGAAAHAAGPPEHLDKGARRTPSSCPTTPRTARRRDCGLLRGSRRRARPATSAASPSSVEGTPPRRATPGRAATSTTPASASPSPRRAAATRRGASCRPAATSGTPTASRATATRRPSRPTPASPASSPSAAAPSRGPRRRAPSTTSRPRSPRAPRSRRGAAGPRRTCSARPSSPSSRPATSQSRGAPQGGGEDVDDNKPRFSELGFVTFLARRCYRQRFAPLDAFAANWPAPTTTTTTTTASRRPATSAQARWPPRRGHRPPPRGRSAAFPDVPRAVLDAAVDERRHLVDVFLAARAPPSPSAPTCLALAGAVLRDHLRAAHPDWPKALVQPAVRDAVASLLALAKGAGVALAPPTAHAKRPTNAAAARAREQAPGKARAGPTAGPGAPETGRPRAQQRTPRAPPISPLNPVKTPPTASPWVGLLPQRHSRAAISSFKFARFLVIPYSLTWKTPRQLTANSYFHWFENTLLPVLFCPGSSPRTVSRSSSCFNIEQVLRSRPKRTSCLHSPLCAASTGGFRRRASRPRRHGAAGPPRGFDEASTTTRVARRA